MKRQSGSSGTQQRTHIHTYNTYEKERNRERERVCETREKVIFLVCEYRYGVSECVCVWRKEEEWCVCVCVWRGFDARMCVRRQDTVCVLSRGSAGGRERGGSGGGR